MEAALFRITARPNLGAMRDLVSARDQYFRIHNANEWPKHDCDLFKRINYAGWSTMLGKQIATARDMDTQDWQKLASIARSARAYPKHYTPKQFRAFREFRKLVRVLNTTQADVDLLRRVFESAGVDLP